MKSLLVIILLFFSFTSISQCLMSSKGNSDISVSEISSTFKNPITQSRIKRMVEEVNDICGISAIPFYYNDELSHNAFASPDDGNIYIGRFLLEDCRQKAVRGAATQFVVMHELSHIYQFNHKGSNAFFNNRNVTRLELQADFLAGYLLVRTYNIDTVLYSNLPALVQQCLNLGDYYFKSPDHHGTPEQRKAMALQGCNSLNLSLQEAYKNSFVYVNQILGY